MRTLGPALVLVVGVLLTFGRMYADGEPGAVPLLLVVVGVAWLLVARARTRPASPRRAGE